MKILIINGSLGGSHKNSAVVLEHINFILNNEHSLQEVQTQVIHLNENDNHQKLESSLLWADSFIFLTGTYWDSWGSPLQKFLEVVTEWEAREHFFAKPAAVVVTMHSVGGKGVLSRLQGVLVTLGCLIPPMSGLVISLASELALKYSSEHDDDFWQLGDLQVVLHNLFEAAKFKSGSYYRTWQVDRKNYLDTWLKID